MIVYPKTQETTTETLAVSPNPFVPSRGHTQISFLGSSLARIERIYIYNKTGELVKTIEEKDKFSWNAKSENEKDLASGVYIYVAKEKSGTTRKGKFAIIR
jgi:flagellar hook assembly protein FlgD